MKLLKKLIKLLKKLAFIGLIVNGMGYLGRYLINHTDYNIEASYGVGFLFGIVAFAIVVLTNGNILRD